MLTYNEIKNVLSRFRFFGSSDDIVQCVIGKEELKDKVITATGIKGINFDKAQYEHSGILFKAIDMHPLLKKLSLGRIIWQYKTFETTEELETFLKTYTTQLNLEYKQSQEDITKQYKKLPDDIMRYLQLQFQQLLPEQKSSLVAYKSRLNQIMNLLWMHSPTTKNLNIEDFAALAQKDLSYEKSKLENDYYLSETEKIKIQSQINFQDLVKQQFAFFKKALANPNNKEFFDKIPGLDLSNEANFVRSIFEYMKIMEGIDSIRMPADVKLFRGIFGTSDLEEISVSTMASCTPDMQTAINFALAYNQGYTGTGSKALVGLDIKAGTPIIPLMFSVKTSIKIDDETAIFDINYDNLPDDSITLEVVENENDIQDEIVINTTLCNIAGLKESDSTTHSQQKITELIPNFGRDEIKPDKSNFASRYIEYFEQQDILRTFFRKFNPVISSLKGYSYAIYLDVPVSAITRTHNTETELPTMGDD